MPGRGTNLKQAAITKMTVVGYFDLRIKQAGYKSAPTGPGYRAYELVERAMS
jgi:hypothetical protein